MCTRCDKYILSLTLICHSSLRSIRDKFIIEMSTNVNCQHMNIFVIIFFLTFCLSTPNICVPEDKIQTLILESIKSTTNIFGH